MYIDYKLKFVAHKIQTNINQNLLLFIVSATFTGVETLEWAWFCHHREHFLLIIVSGIEQTYQQNGRKLRAKVFLSATIFCKHFDMVSKLMRYKNARVVFNFPSSLHKVVSSSKHRVQSILCIKTCKVLVSWVVKQIFLKIFHKLDSVS